MFYHQLKQACINNKTTVTAVLKQLKLGTANGTYWKNGSIPASDTVVKLAEYLNVSTDYLLIGKEQNVKDELSENDREMLSILHKFNEREQIKFIGRAEQMANEYLKEITGRRLKKEDEI